MSAAPVKLIGFAAALLLVFGATFGVARAVSPNGLERRGDTGHGAGHGDEAPEAHADADAAGVPGLGVEQYGYRLVPEATILAAGEATPFRFRLDGPVGGLVRAYEPLHERELHLIVVRRDLSGFQHVHPTRGPDGSWTTTLALAAGGTWRAFADFSPVGGPGQVTLGVDLQVPGPFQPATGPAPAVTAPAELDVSFVRSGSQVAVTVSRAGAPVLTEPYLGARGHLVALRAGDLAYLHVHPVDAASMDGHGTGGPAGGTSDHSAAAVRFALDAPTPGTYALYFDYQLDGVVHTATTTIEVTR